MLIALTTAPPLTDNYSLSEQDDCESAVVMLPCGGFGAWTGCTLVRSGFAGFLCLRIGLETREPQRLGNKLFMPTPAEEAELGDGTEYRDRRETYL